MIHVGVIFGGPSVEHEVSVITAMQAIHQLKHWDKYKIVPLYLSKEDNFYTGDYLMDIENYKDINKIKTEAINVHLIKGETSCELWSLKGKLSSKCVETIDLFFPIIHGTGGEDGTLQGLLEHMGLPYVGCDVLSAALTMDKVASKLFLEASGIPMCPGTWFTNHQWFTQQEECIKKCEAIGYPLIIKPSNLGSSVGVKKCHDRASLIEAVDFTRKFTNRIMVERMVTAMREVNVALLGDHQGVEVSVTEEPFTEGDFLSYEDKYMSDSGKSKGMTSLSRKIPADLPADLDRRIKDIAKEAFLHADCAGVCRIDFIYDTDREEIYLNELNTIPGSLAFYLWEASGKSFDELVEALIQISYRKYRRNERLVRTQGINLLQSGTLKGIKK